MKHERKKRELIEKVLQQVVHGNCYFLPFTVSFLSVHVLTFRTGWRKNKIIMKEMYRYMVNQKTF